MSQYWSEYWQQGFLTSFGDDIKGNYSGVLADVWCQFFAALPQSDLTVLDIGTGNGALIDLVRNQLGHSEYRFLGVDYATLSIPDELKHQSIEFFPKTSAEKLPFADASVDVVMAQFGLEYADIDAAVNEINRVLTADGCLQLVMHDSQSTIVKPNKQILEAIESLQGDDSPLPAMRRLFNALAKSGQGSPAAEQCRAQLNQQLQTIGASNQGGLFGSGFPALLKAVMQPALQLKQRKEMLKKFERDMAGQKIRLTDLVAAAMTEDKKQAITAQLTQLGFSQIEHSAIEEQDGKLIGWRLYAKR